MNRKLEIDKRTFDNLNSTKDYIKDEYLYYDNLTEIYKNLVDLSNYLEEDENGQKIISRNNLRKCLIEQCEEYKTFVVEEVLDDIDRYGYYGTEEFEGELGILSAIIDSDLTPDDIGMEAWEALGNISERSFKKYKDKSRKGKRTDNRQKKFK